MVKQFMPKAGEAILALFSKLGGNMNNVLGTKSNINFLGKGKNTEAFLDSDINVEAIGVLGKNKILEELEGSIGYLTAGKLNDVQANKLLQNMTKIDEVFNPKQVANITDMATGTGNLDAKGLASLRRMTDETADVDLPPPGSRGGAEDIAAPVMNVEDVVTMQGKGGMDFIDFVRAQGDEAGAAKLQKEVDRLNAASDAADARFAIANMPDAPSKRATAREFLVEALKEDDTFATKLGSVISAEDVKYITEGGGGIAGDPLVLVEKYFGPRISEMIPPGASNEEIILFTRRVMNNVEDAAGFKPDNPRFDRFTARFVDEVQDFAKGGLAKILEV